MYAVEGSDSLGRTCVSENCVFEFGVGALVTVEFHRVWSCGCTSWDRQRELHAALIVGIAYYEQAKELRL